MKESEMTAVPVFALLGVLCIAAAIGTGLLLRKIYNKTVVNYGNQTTPNELKF